MSGWGRFGAIALGAAGVAACGSAFESGATGGAGAGTTTGAGGATTTTGAGGAVTSTGAGGGTVTSNGGGGQVETCTPGEKRACYHGPSSTRGKGVCREGEQTCTEGGTWPSECFGEVLPTDETCGKGVDADCNGVVCGQALGAITMGGEGADEITSVAVDTQGNVYVGGRTDRMILGGKEITPPGDERALFLAKLGPNLEVLWAKAIGSGPNKDDGGFEVRLAIGPGDQVFVAGTTTAKLDLGGGAKPIEATSGPVGFVGEVDPPNGEGKWAAAIRSDADAYVAAVVATDKNVYATGWACCNDLTIGPEVYAATSYGGYVARFDHDGKLGGAVEIGGAMHVYPRAAAAYGGDEIVVAGYFADAFSWPGGEVAHPGGNEGFLVRLDPLATLAATAVGGKGSDSLSAVARRSNGTIVSAGQAESTIEVPSGLLTAQAQDALLVLTGSDATLKAGWLYGDDKAQVARALAVDADDRTYVAIENWDGKVTVAGSTLTDHGIVAAIAKNDVPRWGRGVSGTVRALATHAKGVVAVGEFTGALVATPLPSIGAKGTSDAFVVVYAP